FYNGSLYVSDNGGTFATGVDGDGNPILDPNSNVYRIAVSKNATTGKLQAGAASVAVGGFVAAGGFTFASNGDMYVGDFGAGYIEKLASGSSTATPFVLPGTSPLETPNGMVLAGGNLYVADLFGNQVLKYDSNGNYK